TLDLLKLGKANKAELMNKTALSSELLDACIEFLIQESKIDFNSSGEIFLK
ncbi:MAG: hypothetical protein RL131_714, partial [Bacteroidota bacterium]